MQASLRHNLMQTKLTWKRLVTVWKNATASAPARLPWGQLGFNVLHRSSVERVLADSPVAHSMLAQFML